MLCYTIYKGDDGFMYNSERIEDIKRILNNDEVLFEAFNSLYEFVSQKYIDLYFLCIIILFYIFLCVTIFFEVYKYVYFLFIGI